MTAWCRDHEPGPDGWCRGEVIPLRNGHARLHSGSVDGQPSVELVGLDGDWSLDQARHLVRTLKQLIKAADAPNA